MWKKYFILKKVKPGELNFPRPFGRIDFRSDNLDINMLKKIVEDDRNFPYLEMTQEGLDHFYDDDNESTPDLKGNEEPLFNAKELVKLIKESTDQDKLSKYYNLGIEYSSVKKAYNKRIEQIYQGS